MKDSKFILFKNDVASISLPEKFTFPFYYMPHLLAKIASAEVQEYLNFQNAIGHDFGLGESATNNALGKMFGVLVVRDHNGALGYLAAYSGKLANSNHHARFVPPIFDRLEEGSYFMTESRVLDLLNKKILKLEAKPQLNLVLEVLEKEKNACGKKIKQQKEALKKNQKERQNLRNQEEIRLTVEEFKSLKGRHNQESINDNFLLREYTVYLKGKLLPFQLEYDKLIDHIDKLKTEMRSKSVGLQGWLFSQYDFLDYNGKEKNVVDIFKNRIPSVPPSGAGDCAAPKLLQYAYQNKLKPIALAEFWWGKSPNSNSRKHGYFYPSCRGKCEPILGHMMQGLDVDKNPLLENTALGKTLEIVYEDEHLLVINKPAEFMSVPGKMVTDSVQERLKLKYPKSTGPMIVHRLDMSTSGLMIVAKSKDAHKALQEQFKIRNVKKRYVAVLDGDVKEDKGYIDLPLRVDLENRPFQIACSEYGKSARTKYEVVSRKCGKTRIHFYPITGRTHQLRVHASHHLGLNAPIVGDDLYGLRAERLHLHAEEIAFTHPISREEVSFSVEAEF